MRRATTHFPFNCEIAWAQNLLCPCNLRRRCRPSLTVVADRRHRRTLTLSLPGETKESHSKFIKQKSRMMLRNSPPRSTLGTQSLLIRHLVMQL
ncbi:unnamed protein product [Peronospora belbahrii]|uniref:Uncharacterized protein n=1 Tax=Peronospora belbahrii TaxID=622444 RepID=A0AAU9KW12_9STRA|nr:unnamed protein product [Peronospora belbahrii]